MDITITFDKDRWTIDPEPAIVTRGTEIRWVFRAPKSQFRNLRWVIRFSKTSPFRDVYEVRVKTTNTGFGTYNPVQDSVRKTLESLGLGQEADFDHRGSTKPVTAENPGDHKYVVRVDNDDTNSEIASEDPIVRVVAE